MARKRLLTILAGAVAVIGFQLAPATALDVEQDLDVVTVEASVSEDGVEAELSDGDDKKLKAKLDEEGVEVEAEDGDDQEKVSTDDVVDEDEDDDEADEPSSREADNDDSGGSFSTSGGGEVTAAAVADSVASEHQRPDALDPARARQLLPSSGEGPDGSGAPGELTTGFDLSSDFENPLVAAPPEQSTSDGGDWAPLSPEQERSDAELAAIPAAPQGGDAVPAGLKLLAGLLVAGTGTLWHLARRELATTPTTASRS